MNNMIIGLEAMKDYCKSQQSCDKCKYDRATCGKPSSWIITDKSESRLDLSLPAKPGDTIYVVDTDVASAESLCIDYMTVECIVVLSDDDILFEHDNYDGVICHLKHLITDSLYLDCYRCFTSEQAAKEFIKEQGGDVDDATS